jgi:hypothetical protein
LRWKIQTRVQGYAEKQWGALGGEWGAVRGWQARKSSNEIAAALACDEPCELEGERAVGGGDCGAGGEAHVVQNGIHTAQRLKWAKGKG